MAEALWVETQKADWAKFNGLRLYRLTLYGSEAGVVVKVKSYTALRVVKKVRFTNRPKTGFNGLGFGKEVSEFLQGRGFAKIFNSRGGSRIPPFSHPCLTSKYRLVPNVVRTKILHT